MSPQHCLDESAEHIGRLQHRRPFWCALCPNNAHSIDQYNLWRTDSDVLMYSQKRTHICTVRPADGKRKSQPPDVPGNVAVVIEGGLSNTQSARTELGLQLF